VKLKLYRSGSPGTVTVSIRATSASKPTGSDLTSGTINGNTLTTDTAGAWYEIALTLYRLLANTKYAIVVRAESGTSGNALFWRCDGTSPTYSGGAVCYSSNSGVTWGNEDANADMMFEVWSASIEGYVKATKVNLAEDAPTVLNLSFYSHATGNVRLGIYDDSSGPNALKWESGSVACSAAAWTTKNISEGTPTSLTLPAGTYWLAYQWGSANVGPSYCSGGTSTGAYLAQAYGAFPNPMTGETVSTENWSIYVTYGLLYLSGVTKDGAGNILGSCTVWLFKASDKSYVASTTSDPTTGVYSFQVTVGIAYFVRAFKDGSNVFGCTDDDLVGA
jgi:hypothetical protein